MVVGEQVMLEVKIKLIDRQAPNGSSKRITSLDPQKSASRPEP